MSEWIPRPVRLVAGLALPLGLALAPLAGAAPAATPTAPAAPSLSAPTAGVTAAAAARPATRSSRVTARAVARSAPRVAIGSPADGATVRGKVRLTATASSSAGIARVEFRVDGVLRATDRTAPYAFGDTGYWTTTRIADGAHTVAVTAVDKSGRSVRDVHTVTVDNVRDPVVVPPAPDPEPEPLPEPEPVEPEPDPEPAPAPPPATPPADTTAPTAPGNLRVTDRTGTSVAVAWNASTDAVGVTGYEVALNGSVAGTGTALSRTFTGLSCGTSHGVRVVALDAAGNRSAAVNLTVSTTDCTPPPPPPSAASVFLSPSGNDAAACTVAAPCRTLGRGYRVAAPGQIVQVAAGSYAGGTISPDASKASATQRVVLQPAPGAAVTVTSELLIDAKHIEFRDMTMSSGWQTLAQAADVLMEDIDAKHFFITSSQGVTVRGGRVGPGVDYHPIIGASNATPPRNVLVEGVLFHDWTASNSSVHTECLQIGAGDGITIRGNRFVRCAQTGNMHVTHWGESPRTRNVTIENNFYSTTIGGYYALQAYAIDNLLIRNNSATQGFLIMPSGPVNNVRLVANLAPMPSYACVSGVQYRNNVWFDASNPAKCGTTDHGAATSDPGFTNAAAGDLHLVASSPALGRGNAADGSVTDIDGDARDAGTPDAGADER